MKMMTEATVLPVAAALLDKAADGLAIPKAMQKPDVTATTMPAHVLLATAATMTKTRTITTAAARVHRHVLNQHAARQAARNVAAALDKAVAGMVIQKVTQKPDVIAMTMCGQSALRT